MTHEYVRFDSAPRAASARHPHEAPEAPEPALLHPTNPTTTV
jgi:hypothetical protein